MIYVAHGWVVEFSVALASSSVASFLFSGIFSRVTQTCFFLFFFFGFPRYLFSLSVWLVDWGGGGGGGGKKFLKKKKKRN